MTRDGDGPRKGDRVRWTRMRPQVIEGILEDVDGDAYAIRDGELRLHACQTEDVTVEVLERADDPSSDEVGTVRKDPEYGEVVAKVSLSREEGRPWHSFDGGSTVTDQRVKEWPVIGAVPGTPAAEAQNVGIGQILPDGYASWAEYHEKHPYKPRDSWAQYHADGIGLQQEMDALKAKRSVRAVNEPHGLPTSVRQAAADRLAAGDKDAAVRGLYHFGMTRAAAESYVEGMSEYQSYLSEHGETRQPREFRADGPEPPADVRVLEWLDAPEGRRYLKRFEAAWLWVDGPHDRDPGGVGEWPPFHPGRYREVLS